MKKLQIILAHKSKKSLQLNQFLLNLINLDNHHFLESKTMT